MCFRLCISYQKVEKNLVWIRFPWLNLLYYDKNVLLGMTSVIGSPIKVNTNTFNIEKGRLTRI